jgi:glutamine amidotransferase
MMIDELLFKTKHGLVDQSLHSRMGAETTNGDGFGLGWYGTGDGPGVYRSVEPAWGDANLRHLTGHIESPLFLSHVRASSGSPVQETNCHPFRHGPWLFVHNGLINDFGTVRRDLMMELEPRLFAEVQGTTDSELLFHLALSNGLESDPLEALEQTIGLVEARLRQAGVEPALQTSMGLSDGERLWAVRYSSEGHSRTLFTSEDVDSLRRLHPDNPRLQQLREGDRLVVSEPFTDLPGAWLEIPEATALLVGADGSHEQRPFQPRDDA